MFFFTYTGFLLALVCAVFATYILKKKRHDILAWYFCLDVYAVTLWIGSNAFADLAKTPLQNILGAGCAFIGVSFLISYYLCFVYAFVHKRPPSLPLKFVYFFPAVVFSLGAFSRYSIVDTIFPPGMPSAIVPGVFYTYHLIWFILTVLYTVFVLGRFLRIKADKQERNQAIFMWSGFFILFAATVFFGIVLPVFFNELRFFNVGPQFSFIFILFSSYAILRHRLFDIELIIKKSVVFALLFATIFFVFTVLVTLLASVVPGLLSNVLAAAIITGIFSPLKSWLEAATDRVLFTRRRSFEEIIGVFNESLAKVQTVEDLVEVLPSFVRYALKVDMISLFLLNDSNTLVAQMRKDLGLHSIRLPDNSAILDALDYRIQHQLNPLDVMERDDLTYRVNYEYYAEEEKQRLTEVRRELETVGYSAVVPFVSNGRVIGLLFLGPRLSGDHYSQIDFRVLNALAHETSIALENAMNYERTARLNELKSEFVSVVSHQLRTPLIAAKWNAELLLGKNVSDELAEPIGDVQVNLLRLNEGLNSMLTVLSIEQNQLSLKRARVNFLQSVVESVVREFKIEADKKHVRVTVRSKPKQVLAYVDSEKMKKVVAVLLSNAIAYTPERSTVLIDIEGSPQGLTVAVEDQGFGVAKNNRTEIFERFFRGSQAKKMSPDGLGINLYIAREFVTRHDGKLWVEDRKDGLPGARFVFTIPGK